MLLYSLACKDAQTGNDIMASELTFNMACSYLAELSRPINGVKGKVGSNYIFYEQSKPKYIYDEKRGYLMKIKEEEK